MKAIKTLEQKLRKAKGSRKAYILHGVYKQLAASHKGRKTRGQFREFVENDSYEGHYFVKAVVEQLNRHGLFDEAKRLREQYSGVPQKPERSWTEAPNVLGDGKAVEELCLQGEWGKELAALGAIAAVFGKLRKAEDTTTRYLYPTSRQFPFDEVTGKIVRALEERNFDVPGIDVDFYSYGPRDSYHRVDTVEGNDFRIKFGRVQGRIGTGWNNTAALSTIAIPRKELCVYDDNSGPTFYLYVGDNWDADKKRFFHSLKANSKLMGEPRTYLQFTGSWQKKDGGIFYPGRVAPFLAHTTDLGREYSPIGDEPGYFKTQEVFQEFKTFLEQKLKQITQY